LPGVPSICALSTTLTLAGTSAIDRAERVAVTTIACDEVASCAEAAAETVKAQTATVEKRSFVNM
jgi:hypothetical protein